MEEHQIKSFNILLLSSAFMMIFTGSNTMTGVLTLVFKSATTPGSGGYVEGFSGDGYICATINYAVFAAASWTGPSLVALKGSIENIQI